MKDPIIVALDTMPIIWGMSDRERIEGGGAKEGEVELSQRSLYLFEQLESEGASMVISAISVAEVLAGIPDDNHGDMVEILQSRFEVISYGPDAGSLAAKLHRQHKHEKSPLIRGRNLLKNDLHIIASVYKFGARVFYSHDELARKIAIGLGMEARGLPTHSPNLFDPGPKRKKK